MWLEFWDLRSLHSCPESPPVFSRVGWIESVRLLRIFVSNLPSNVFRRQQECAVYLERGKSSDFWFLTEKGLSTLLYFELHWAERESKSFEKIESCCFCFSLVDCRNGLENDDRFSFWWYSVLTGCFLFWYHSTYLSSSLLCPELIGRPQLIEGHMNKCWLFSFLWISILIH
jgi:hypothetical protein